MLKEGKPTEPINFIIIKELYRIFQWVLIISYAGFQLYRILKSASEPFVNFRQKDLMMSYHHSIFISFCGLKDINITYVGCNYDIDDMHKPVNCTSNQPEQTVPINAHNTQDSYNNNCQSFEFLFNKTNILWLDINSLDPTPADSPLNLQDYDKPKMTETFILGNNYPSSNILSIRLKRLKIDDKSYKSSTSPYFLKRGSFAILDYSPEIDKDSDKPLNFNSKMIELPFNLTNTSTTLGIRPRTSYASFREKVNSAIIMLSLISDVGGFFASLSATYVLLFGSERLNPWGILQIYLLSCVEYKKRFTKHLAKKYISVAGIPFSEDVKDMPIYRSTDLPISLEDRHQAIENRIQMIEFLLKEYFLNVNFLEIVKKEKDLYSREASDNIP